MTATLGPLHPDLAALGLLLGLVVVATARVAGLRAATLVAAPACLLVQLVSAERYPATLPVVAVVGLAAGLLVGEGFARRPDARGADVLADGSERYLALALAALLGADAVVWLCVPDTEGAVLVGAALAPVVLDVALGALDRRPAWLPAPAAIGPRGQLAAVAAWLGAVAAVQVGGSQVLPASASAARAVLAPTVAVLVAVAAPLLWLVTSARARPPR